MVGNTTYGLWATAAAVVGVSFALGGNPLAALLADGAILVVYLMYLGGTYLFAHKHPDMAMLGDTEWLKWSQNQITARDKSIVIDQAPELGANTSLVKSNDA